MKDSLLDALIKFTLSRYNGNINAPCSPKLISFFQTVYALSPKFYRIFSQNFGGYNERTLRRFEAEQAPEVSIIDCSPQAIKYRTKAWIDQLRSHHTEQIILVSAMADATKVPPLGEFSQRYRVWVGGTFPNHCISETNYDQDEFVKTEMATEIKVGMLSLQNTIDGVSPFKIIAARPQSTNEAADEYNSLILHAVDEIENVHCVSMAFDGLSTETQFIRNNLISFMNGTTNSVAMTDCNHAAKNMRSQLVLGSSIVVGGNAFFDVGILRLAGIPMDLYRVSDYASDVLVLKLCSSDTINKLMNLISTNKEDPLNVGFMAMTLYFLRTFLCAYNGIDINSECRVTMLWSAMMWFSSLDGIHKTSKRNFITSCLGGIFLATQRSIVNLRSTTTEPLEHTFGTARSWRREFTICEFITYCNKVDIIMKNVIEHDIKTSTSNKGYMHGFQGFTNVVRNIREKLAKEKDSKKQDDWSVEVDYTFPIPLIDQIEDKVISAINRIRIPIVNIMKMYGMTKVSTYCTDISSISDLCSIYQSSSKQSETNSNVGILAPLKNKTDTATIIQRLTNLAMDFNSGNATDINTINENIDISNFENFTPPRDKNIIVDLMKICFINL